MPDISNWSSMKKLIYLRGNPATGQSEGKIPLTLTAGAAPMLVQTTKKTKVTSCAVSFSPWQEGSGDPSPENIRAVRGWRGCRVHRTGTNIWDEEWEVGTFDTTTGVNLAVSNQIRTKNKIPIIGGASYFFSVPPNYAWFIFFDAEGNVLTDAYISDRRSGNSSSIYSGSSFTAPNNARYMRFYMLTGYGDTYKNNIAINYPATVTTYTPYTGETTEISFGGHTKNLLDPNIKFPAGEKFGLALTTSDDGHSFAWSGTANESGNIQTNIISTEDAIILPPGTYISKNGTLSLYRPNGTWLRNQYSGHVFTIDEPFFVKNIYWQIVSGNTYNVSDYIMLVAGSTAPTQYEPYGTIYGGTADVVTGDASETKKLFDIGNIDWFWNSTYKFYHQVFEDKAVGVYNVIADRFKNTNGSWSGTVTKDTIFGNGSNNTLYVQPVEQYADVEAFKSAMKGSTAVYALATPTPVTVPAQSITLPKGDSYIWAEMIA